MMSDIQFCLEADGDQFYQTIEMLVRDGYVHLNSGVDNGKAWVCLGLPSG